MNTYKRNANVTDEQNNRIGIHTIHSGICKIAFFLHYRLNKINRMIYTMSNSSDGFMKKCPYREIYHTKSM